MMENYCAAILAGGLGTRLRPAHHGTPKVLARVSGRPFITILLDQLQLAGIKNVVLLTGYHADQVRQALGDRYGSMDLSYSVEATPLGTGGALRHALPLLCSETVLMLNGDSYCDTNLRTLAHRHRSNRALATITLAQVQNSSRYGKVELASDGILTAFEEKRGDASPGWINAGIYALERSIVEEIPDLRFISLEHDLLPRWVHQRQVHGLKCAGSFLDIGTPESLADANAFFSNAAHGSSNCTAHMEEVYAAS